MPGGDCSYSASCALLADMQLVDVWMYMYASVPSIPPAVPPAAAHWLNEHYQCCCLYVHACMGCALLNIVVTALFIVCSLSFLQAIYFTATHETGGLANFLECMQNIKEPGDLPRPAKCQPRLEFVTFSGN